MLFTIKQLIDERKRIVEVLFASENGSDSQQPIMPIDEKLNNPNVAVSDLSEGEVKNFLERLDRGYFWKGTIDTEGDNLTADEIKKLKNLLALVKVPTNDKSKGDYNISNNSEFWVGIKDIMENFVIEERKIISRSVTQTEKLENDLHNNAASTEPEADTTNDNLRQEEADIKTIEDNTARIDIKFGFGEDGKEDYKSLRKNINNNSFDNIIVKMNYEDLKGFYDNIVKESNTNNKNEAGTEYYYTPFNSGKVQELFTKAGYKPDGFFGGIEVASLVALVGGIYRTQERVNDNKTDWKGKLGLVLDYDRDGKLKDGFHFYTPEKALFKNVKTEENFGNLLKNLGYTNGTTDFYKALEHNFSSARGDFKDRLGTLLSMSLDVDKMLINPDYIKNHIEQIKQTQAEVTNTVNSNPKTASLPDDTKKLLVQDIISKFEGASLIVGANTVAGASFDIKEVTNNILDHLVIGMVDGKPGIGVIKDIEIGKDGKWKLSVGVVNFIPLIGVNGVITEDELKDYENDLKLDSFKGTQISGGATLTPTGVGIIGTIHKVNEKTKEGIEAAKKRLGKTLDKAFIDIKQNKSFGDSDFSSEKASEQVYNRLAALYKTLGKNVEAEKFLKEGTLNNYERYLYENAGNGIHFSGLSVGVIFSFAGGFIPAIGLNGERHTTNWKEIKKTPTAKQTVASAEKPSVKPFTIEGIEKLNDTDLINKLKGFEQYFNYGTRYNKGAEDFINPSGGIEKQWKGLKTLASLTRTIKKKKVKILGDLGKVLNDIDNLPDGGDKTNKKLIIISTLSGYIRRASDFNNGDVSIWNFTEEKVNNTNVEKARRKDPLLKSMGEMIKIDAERGEKFDKIINLKKSREKYHQKLQEARNENKIIGRDVKQGVGFDVVSSLNVGPSKKTVRGIQPVYTNINIFTVDGNPLTVDLEDAEKKDFLNKIKKLDFAYKDNIINGINNGNIVLYYYKDTNGFNDRIGLRFEGGSVPPTSPGIPPTEELNPVTPQGLPNYHTENYVLGYTPGTQGKDDDHHNENGEGNSDAETTPEATPEPTPDNPATPGTPQPVPPTTPTIPNGNISGAGSGVAEW